jgi:hypothetical protein
LLISKGVISISRIDQFGKLVSSVTNSFSPLPWEVQYTQIVQIDLMANLDNLSDKIVLQFNLEGQDFSKSVQIPELWNKTGSISVFASELIGNTLKYKDPFRYNGASFTILPN